MIEKKLTELNLRLPPSPTAKGQYTPVVIHEGIAYVSGQLSRGEDDRVVQGRAGESVGLEAARAAAGLCMLRSLSCLRHELGSLDRITRALKMVGYVNAAPQFKDYSAVLDGASGLLLALFGEQGRHARTTVGVAGLPGGGVVEIDLVVAVRT